MENFNRAPVEKRHGAAQNTGVKWRVVKSDQGVGNYGEFVPGGQTPGTSPSCGHTHQPAQQPCRTVALCYPMAVSQPVKLSDALVLDARLAGEIVERSIAGQVEFWARLGRSVELLLQGHQVLALCRNSTARPLSACLESVDSPEGRQRVAGV